MATSFVTYLGNLRTEMHHVQSSSLVQTDAPVDNHGNGERFSPTDLVSTALASCAMTIMGIAAKTHHIALNHLKAEVTKGMSAAPRKISRVEVNFELSNDLAPKERAILENAAKTCPVALSLHPDVEQLMTFAYV